MHSFWRFHIEIAWIVGYFLLSYAAYGQKAQEALKAAAGPHLPAPGDPDDPVPVLLLASKDDDSPEEYRYKNCRDAVYRYRHKDKCKKNDDHNTWWVVLLSVLGGLALIALASILIACCCCSSKRARRFPRPLSAKSSVAPLPPSYASTLAPPGGATGGVVGATGALPTKDHPPQFPTQAVWTTSVTSPPAYDSDLPPHYSV